MTDALTKPPRIVVLLPQPDGDAGSPDAPIALADLLAADMRAVFEMVRVDGVGSDVQPAIAYRRANRVWYARHRELGANPRIDALLQACEEALERIGLAKGEPAVVLLPAGIQGEEIAARLSVRFEGAALGRCIDIEHGDGKLRIRRAAFGGRAHTLLHASRGPCFGTVRRASRVSRAQAAREPVGTPESMHLELSQPLPPDAVVRVEEMSQQARPLEGARIVISGGRGMESEAGFALLHELADVVGAAVGGSLPAVDAGWVPVARQVGQSGKYVTPRVYVALGISGTPQHLAGIGPDTRIIAINSDPAADIFGVAELGVVADWKALLPALLARLRAEAP